jgi:hypothetical protein
VAYIPQDPAALDDGLRPEMTVLVRHLRVLSDLLGERESGGS